MAHQDKNEWDFYEYEMATDTMFLASLGDDPAQLQFRKSLSSGALEIGIFLGEKHRWFPLTQDATDCLQDYLDGRAIGSGARLDEEVEDADEYVYHPRHPAAY